MASLCPDTSSGRPERRVRDGDGMTTRLYIEGHALCWRREAEVVRVEAWGRDSARVRITRGRSHGDGYGALLASDASTSELYIRDDEATTSNGKRKTHRVGVLENGRLRVELTHYGMLRFLDVERGVELLSERPPDAMGYPARFFHDDGGPGQRLAVEFSAYEDERIYGMGQHPHGRLDHKGCTLELHHHNATFSIPFALSSRAQLEPLGCGPGLAGRLLGNRGPGPASDPGTVRRGDR